ncbi:ribonuclease P protein component [Candidatus Tachikawaea gelatinosa]|uniref:Ribonuclease P protein component n=1 Tax=Candidatus Tachikawaea gelatinosa TaxID=1410383 RepID=A0A090AIN6_9ENTR|nr:ribonuclease P protein component [Candidatus Tachikawaea gelatinosa]BAP58278.1 ribonuclease P protein component [Candidatus Tachikawaea gelatinosa]
MKNLNLTFPKNLKLLKKRDFYNVFKQSKKIHTKEITVFFSFNLFKNPRIGIIIGKKYIKYSHDRNRIKRLIKENFRLFQHRLPNVDFVIMIKKDICNFSNKKITNLMEQMWYYLQKI